MYYNHYCPPMYDGTCPSCGRCNHCGRGGGLYPLRVYCQASVNTNEHPSTTYAGQSQVPNVLDDLIDQATKR